MRVLICLSMLVLLSSCGVPLSRDAFFDAPEVRLLDSLTKRLAAGDVASIEAEMYDQSNPAKNRAELERLAAMLEDAVPDSQDPGSWEVRKTLSGLRVVKVSIQYGFGSRGWVLMSGEFVGPPDQLKVASYHLKGFEFAPSVTNAFTLSGKGAAHYAFLLLLPAAFLLSLYALVRCLRTKGLRRKGLWVVFIVLGLCTFTLDWTTGAFEFQPISTLVMSAAFTRDGYIGPWTFEFSLPIGALLFLVLHGRARREGATQFPPPSGAPAG